MTVDNSSDTVINIADQTFWINDTTVEFTAASLAAATTDNDTSLTYAASENGTSAPTTGYSTTPTFNGADGDDTTVYIWATDSMGNGPGLIDNLTLKIDTSAPSIETWCFLKRYREPDLNRQPDSDLGI